MGQAKKTKEEKHQAVTMSLHPKYVAMKKQLQRRGISISSLLQKAIEEEFAKGEAQAIELVNQIQKGEL